MLNARGRDMADKAEGRDMKVKAEGRGCMDVACREFVY